MSAMIAQLRVLKEAHAEGLIDDAEYAAVRWPYYRYIILTNSSARQKQRQ